MGPGQEGRSSNHRELRNLVKAVKEALEAGLLTACELFLFTDNSSAKGAYYRGHSSSELLDELVLELHEIGLLVEGFILHVVHVAGTRMIAMGIDGLSQGDMAEGAMRGQPLSSFMPLHESPLSRLEALEPLLRSWWDGDGRKLKLLTPEGWFEEGHRNGCYLWDTPPAAGEAAVDQLGWARHKQPHASHVFVCPRLMAHLFRKKLGKVADAVVTLPVGTNPWPTFCHQPLLIGLCLPPSISVGGRARRAALVERLDGEM